MDMEYALWVESSKNGKKTLSYLACFSNFEMKMKIKIETTKNYIINIPEEI